MFKQGGSTMTEQRILTRGQDPLDAFGADLVAWMMNGQATSRPVSDHPEAAEGASAAMRAWRHYFPEDDAPALLAYLEDAALGCWQLPMSREVSAALASWPRDFATWHDLLFRWEDYGFPILSAEGEGMLCDQERLIENHSPTPGGNARV